MPRYKTRIDIIDRNLEAVIPEAAPAERDRMFQEFAREQIGVAVAQNRTVLGEVPDYEIRVDGAPGPLIRATVRSEVEVEFELASEMYRWIYEMLILNSPVGNADDPRPGHPELYARSHMFFVDGNAYDPEGPAPLPQTEAVFVNVQPYARKIERGLSTQAPEGVYEVVAALAPRRFSNYGSIRFSHRTPFEIGAIHEWAQTTEMASPFRTGEKRQEWLTRQPAIVIRID
jgi:hypothetical protein